VVGTGLGAVRAGRLARFGKACDSLSARGGLPCDVAGATTTGSSGCWFCADAGASARPAKIPIGSAALESQRRGEEIRWKQRARTRDDGRVVEIFEIDTGVTNGEQ
jgi:radical SAM superfamily enzyme